MTAARVEDHLPVAQDLLARAEKARSSLQEAQPCAFNNPLDPCGDHIGSRPFGSVTVRIGWDGLSLTSSFVDPTCPDVLGKAVVAVQNLWMGLRDACGADFVSAVEITYSNDDFTMTVIDHRGDPIVKDEYLNSIVSRVVSHGVYLKSGEYLDEGDLQTALSNLHNNTSDDVEPA